MLGIGVSKGLKSTWFANGKHLSLSVLKYLSPICCNRHTFFCLSSSCLVLLSVFLKYERIKLEFLQFVHFTAGWKMDGLHRQIHFIDEPSFTLF